MHEIELSGDASLSGEEAGFDVHERAVEVVLPGAVAVLDRPANRAASGWPLALLGESEADQALTLDGPRPRPQATPIDEAAAIADLAQARAESDALDGDTAGKGITLDLADAAQSTDAVASQALVQQPSGTINLVDVASDELSLELDSGRYDDAPAAYQAPPPPFARPLFALDRDPLPTTAPSLPELDLAPPPAALASIELSIDLPRPTPISLEAQRSEQAIPLELPPLADGPEPTSPAATPEPSLPGEARIPTRMVAQPARRGAHDGRYGGYALVRELVRAPGALLAEGRDAIGAPWLLQIVRTRAVADEAERLARQHLEHVVAARTAELLDESALGLRAHGVVDEPDGTRTLFWVLPWHPRAPRLAADFSPKPSLLSVVKAGLMLARRMVARHQRGRLEPLMSAAMLAFGDETIAPALLGFPILVAPVAAADTMVPPMLAPEERLHAQPMPTGDLWRLGEVLRKLAESCGQAGLALAPLIAALTDQDPARRPSRAQVVEDLETIGRSTAETARTTEVSAMDPGALSALMLSASAGSTRVEATGPQSQTSSQRALEVALGLAVETLASTPSPAPARAAPPPGPSAASVALAPFAPEVGCPPRDTICEVPTMLRIEEPGEDAPRTVVRTRSRPVVERLSGEIRAPILDRTRNTPEPNLARPSVVGLDAPIDGDDTVRIQVDREQLGLNRSAVVLRTEVRRDVPVIVGEEAETLPGRKPKGDLVGRTIRSAPSYVAILVATAAVALALGVGLGLALPH